MKGEGSKMEKERGTYLDEQSLGVPSWIVRPGMTTPFAPMISVTTAWPMTLGMRAARPRQRRTVRVENIMNVGGTPRELEGKYTGVEMGKGV